MIEVLIGASAAFVLALCATPLWMRYQRAHGIGQPIQDEVVQHAAKAGTPTMGGLVIALGLPVGYLVARAATGHGPVAGATRVVGVSAAAGLVGLVDDWLKVRRRHNLGLSETQKTIPLLAIVAVFCATYLLGPKPCTNLSFTTCSSTGLHLGPVGWSVMALILLWGSSNSVNFTDGIEGLLAGSAVPTCAALTAIGFWEYRHPADYGVSDALGLTVAAAALGGACTGFLWWNIQRTRIFMGDAGSLAIGTAFAALCLSMNVAALMPILAGLYVVEGASSALQRYTFRYYYKRRNPQRRLFRMAPLHHHFEVAGWAESTIVVRFWLLSAIAAAGAAGIFYGAALHWR